LGAGLARNVHITEQSRAVFKDDLLWREVDEDKKKGQKGNKWSV
jgi:hypothetical protein